MSARRRNRVFAKGGDLRCHLVRRESAVLPHHRHHRDVDLWKNIGRRLFNRRNAEQQNKQRHHHEGVWPPKCEFNYPPTANPFYSFSIFLKLSSPPLLTSFVFSILVS